jgi:hypothetical protein
MKNLLPAALLCGLLSAHAQEPRVFDGYDAFYASRPDRIFMGDGEEIAVSPKHEVRIGSERYRLRRAHPFPGESIYPGDLGPSATLYSHADHYCIEGSGATSGTGSRHISVYLIGRKDGRIYKLPSLFGSCLGVGRNADGGIDFLRAKIINYRAAYDADGVVFEGHALARGMFASTPVRLEVRFVEPGNFYRFRSVQPAR